MVDYTQDIFTVTTRHQTTKEEKKAIRKYLEKEWGNILNRKFKERVVKLDG